MKGERTQGSVDLARLGISQKEIARRVRRSRAAVGHWITGQRKPDDDARVLLRDEFGVSTDSWLKPFCYTM